MNRFEYVYWWELDKVMTLCNDDTNLQGRATSAKQSGTAKRDNSIQIVGGYN